MMDRIANDPWVQAIVVVQFAASIIPWFFIIPWWGRHRALLRYEPRRPVPWGAAGAMLAVAFTVITISAALAGNGNGEVAQRLAEPTTRQIVFSLVASMVMQLCGPALLLFVALLSNARRSDIGLPPFQAGAIARDVGIGVAACLAALLPVRLVQIAVVNALGLPHEITKHPMVEMLTANDPELIVLAMATVMAVAVAPIGEEITFRLLFQGWLEKLEDRRLGWRNASSTDDAVAQVVETIESVEGAQVTPIAVAEPPVELTLVGADPPKRGVAGLPYGWGPILLSSLLFAAAHYGYGPEPVPLFVLALVLGYIYQRTHRILPCIVAHALFNLLSMIVLWRVVFLSGG